MTAFSPSNLQIQPYVNGALYSILSIPAIREEARAMVRNAPDGRVCRPRPRHRAEQPRLRAAAFWERPNSPTLPARYTFAIF